MKSLHLSFFWFGYSYCVPKEGRGSLSMLTYPRGRTSMDVGMQKKPLYKGEEGISQAMN